MENDNVTKNDIGGPALSVPEALTNVENALTELGAYAVGQVQPHIEVLRTAISTETPAAPEAPEADPAA